MANVGFARISTVEQDLDIQMAELNDFGCGKIFTDKQPSASKKNESQLASLIDFIRDGDVVVVTKLDSLGHTLKIILNAIDSIHRKKAYLKTLDGTIDTSNNSPFSKATTKLFGVFAQLERDLIVLRTTEGREHAKKKGVHIGRPKTIPRSDRDMIRKALASGKSSVSAQAKKYGVSRTTIIRIRREDAQRKRTEGH